MKKRILSMLLAIVMVVGLMPGITLSASAAEIVASQPANGDGTAENPYQITTVGELYWFATLVNTKAKDGGNNNAHAKLMNNITVNENVIVDGALTSDTSSLNVWTAMGKSFTSSGWFGGSFDGNGKTISGLYVNEKSSYRGFIGYLGEGASIKNLTITDSYFTSTSSTLGAVVGYADLTSVVENCKLTDSVVSGTSSVGGIVGGSDYGEIISNCHVYDCTITGTGDHVGGIAGSAGNYNNEAYIRLCSVNDSSVTGANNVGGILGKGGSLSKTKISACCNYNTSVTATTKYAGGILGYNGHCYSCFVTAQVSAPSKPGPFAGYGNNSKSAYNSAVYGEAINYAQSKAFTTEEIEAGVATYYLTDTTASSAVYVLWGQKIGEDKYPSWNPESNPDYIVYRMDDTENGGYIYYNGDAAAEYEPNEDGIYEIADRSDWYKFAKKAKEDPTIDGILTANIDFTGVASAKMANYVIGVTGKAYTGTFDGDGYTVNNLPEAPQSLFNVIGSGGELKDLNLSGATVATTDTVAIAGLVYNNLGTISNVTVSDVTVSGTTIAAAIVAYNRGVVTNCTASDITVTGKTAAGGIVGVNDSGHTIEDCHVLSGTVKAGTAEYDATAGGICGSSYGGTIKGCTNNAEVSADGGRLETAAGIVGRPVDYNDVSVNIIECSNTGDINGTWAGGISGTDTTSCYVNISLCYNEGAVTGSAAGGIAACGSFNFDDLIINCYNAGLVTATSKAGGIVGDGANNTVKNCHNFGEVVSQDVGAPIAASDRDTWLSGRLINNYGLEGNVFAPYVSSYYDTSSGEYSTAIRAGSSREEFGDGTVTAKLNAGNSETVWYQYNDYPILEQRHVHKWVYALEGTDTIKAECVNAGCDLDNNDGGSMTIVAPAELVYDDTSKDAECTYKEWKPGKPAIVYNDIDRTNVTGQNIVASVTAGEATASVSYQIQPREITASMVTLSSTSKTYNGSEQTVTVTVKYNSSTTLAASADYEITGTTSAMEISTGDGYAVTVTGKGNYIGTVTKYWKINKGSLSTQIELEGWEYLDTPNAPSVTNNPENAEVTYTYYVRAGRGYALTGSDHGAETEGGVPSYAGTYYVGAVIAETEHYLETAINSRQYKMFTIAPREVTNPTFAGLQATYPYENGNEIEPTFTLKDDLGNEIPTSEYTVSYRNNTHGGEATITISDAEGGNYAVSGSATFTIATHSHEWMYELDGTDTIKAICKADGCTNTNGGSVTISAADNTYSGDDVVASYEYSADWQPENPQLTISYGYNKVSAADYAAVTELKNAGYYKASITIGAATASVEYEVKKATPAAPTAPTMENCTDTSITLNSQNGFLYGIQTDSGINWQDSPTFMGLDACTAYTFYVKQTATDNYVESAASDGATFSTDKSYIASVSPMLDQPVKNGTPDPSVAVEEGANYTASAPAWNGNPVKFLGGTVYSATFILTPADSYKFTDATTVTVSGATVEKTLNTDGTLTVTATFSATTERDVASIAVKTNPADMAYTYGETLAPAGLVITVTYDDGTTEEVAYSESNKADFTFGAMNAGATTVSVTYAGKTAVISGIAVAKQSVTAPENAGSKVFNGSTQTATVDISGKPYTVSTNDGGINVGSYNVVLTLSDPANYKWSDSEAATKTIQFNITKANALNLAASATMVKNHTNYTQTIDLTTVSGYSTNPGGAPVFAIASSTTNGLDSTTISGSTLTLVADQADTDNADTVVVEVTGMGNYTDTTKITVTVNYTNKTVVDITGMAAAENLTYSGAAQAGYTGTPTSTYSGEYVYSYSGTDRAGNPYGPSGAAPSNAGDYTLTISIPESSVQYSGSTAVNFSIAPKALTITVANKSAYVGYQAPDLSKAEAGKDYTVDGLVDGDTITVALAYVTVPEMNTTGEYGITAVASNSNYAITVVNGKLKVSYIPSVPTNRLTIEDTTGGDTTVSDKNPEKGDKVTITTEPDKGYEVGKVTVTDENGRPVQVIDNGDGTYSYIQPAGKVTIAVTYVPEEAVFTDVHKGDYYYNAVNWAVTAGITNGITAATFVPDMICTRAQAVTFLWRAAGSPEPKSSRMPFADVAESSYYYDAVLWAVENGITNGTSETTFSPDAECTRAQIVTFLWRSQGAPAASGAVGFTDVADDAYYAAAVRWAVENDVTNGMTATTFGPDAKCTRAQIVTFLYRALAD